MAVLGSSVNARSMSLRLVEDEVRYFLFILLLRAFGALALKAAKRTRVQHKENRTATVEYRISCIPLSHNALKPHHQ